MRSMSDLARMVDEAGNGLKEGWRGRRSYCSPSSRLIKPFPFSLSLNLCPTCLGVAASPPHYAMAAIAVVALRGRANPLMASVPSFLIWCRLCFRSFYSGRLSFLPVLGGRVHLHAIPSSKVLETFREEFEIESHTISIETSKIGRFANGSIVITMDETNMLSSGGPPLF